MEYITHFMNLIDFCFVVFESIIILLIIISCYNIQKEKREKRLREGLNQTNLNWSLFGKTKNYQLNTSKSNFVKAVLSWALKNIPNPNKRNKIPGLEVSYSKPKTKHGIYYSNSKSMCIYVNTHATLFELCDTILHEYKHYLDMPTQAHQKQYNTYTETVGYFENPFEIAAREFALQHRDKCMQDLYQLGYLI